MCVATAKHRKMQERRTNAVEESKEQAGYHGIVLSVYPVMMVLKAIPTRLRIKRNC